MSVCSPAPPSPAPGGPSMTRWSAVRPSAWSTVAPRSTCTPRLIELVEGVARALLAKVGHRGQLHAVVEQRHGRLEPAVVDRGHHGAAARAQPVERGQAHGAAGEHHARQVVAGEQQRLLDRAGGVDDAPGAHLVERAALPHRHEAVEGAERGRRRQHLHAGLARPGGELARARVTALGEQAPARLRALVGQHHVRAQLGRRDRRAEAGRAAPDHEHVRVTAPVLGAPLALLLVLAQLPEPGRVAQHLLVERPQPPRADEGLVVEARRGERARRRGRWRAWRRTRATGCAFMCSTRMPSRSGSVQARTPGAPSTCTRQLGHWPAQHMRPRRRWYLKLREKVRRPAANSAEPIVSPSSPFTSLPSKLNASSRSRSMRSPSRGGRRLTRAAPAAR